MWQIEVIDLLKGINRKSEERIYNCLIYMKKRHSQSELIFYENALLTKLMHCAIYALQFGDKALKNLYDCLEKY